MLRWVGISTAVLVALTSVYLAQPDSRGDQPVVRVARSIVAVGPGDIPDVDGAAAAVNEAVAAYVAEQERLAVEAYLAAEAARIEQERQAAAAAARPRAPVAPRVTNYDPGNGSVWDALAQCESGGDWAYNGPSGFDGGLQFLPSTWLANGGGEFAPYAYMATREEQIIVAERTRAAAGGFGPWPACARRLGLL